MASGKVLLVRTVAMPFLVTSSGFALSILWRWFVVPLGMPVIGIWHAAGLAALLGFATMKARDYEDRESGSVKEAVEKMIERQISAWLVVLICWPIWGLMP
jgi:hypothetical protein